MLFVTSQSKGEHLVTSGLGANLGLSASSVVARANWMSANFDKGMVDERVGV